MEPRFEVVTALTRQQYGVLSDYALKKQKTVVVYRVFTIVFAVLALVNAAMHDLPTALVMLFFCGMMACLSAVMVKSTTTAAWNARNPLMDIAPATYRFDEQYIYDNHPLTATTLDYRLLTDVVETEEYFLLYINKISAYILPKSAFTVGTPEEFRLLIQQKTGRPVVPYTIKKERTRRKCWAIITPILALVLSIALFGVGYINHTVTATSTDGSETLSLQLPLYFTSDYWEDGYRYLYYDDVSVSVWHYDSEYLSECLGEQAVTEQAFQQYFLDLEYREGDTVWQQSANGTWYLNSYYEGSYYRICLFWRDDSCFLVEFGCYEENEGRYAHKFTEWQASVVIEGVG